MNGGEEEQKKIKVIDARGSYCPGPLMELIRAVKQSNVGDIIEVWSSDTGSQRDIPKWTEKAGHEFLGVTHDQGYDRIRVRKVR